MLSVLLWVLLYSLAMAFSIALLGDRSLISGDLLSVRAIFRLFFHWKFIFSMLLALFARLAFIMVNNALLSIPRLADNSTTITAFALAIAYVFVVIVNGVYLKETLHSGQLLGASLVVLGLVFMFR